MKEITCKNCGKKFEVTADRADTAKFCSMECRSDFAKDTFECQQCGKEFEGYKCHNPKYCSRECADKAREGHTPWNKGKSMPEKTKEKLRKANKGNHPKSEFKKGHTPANKGKRLEAMRGEKHPRWKGGKTIHGGGYILIRLSALPEKEQEKFEQMFSNESCLEHRIVAARQLGRSIEPKESVHHINGDKKDNRPENLYLFEAEKEHVKHHETDSEPLTSNLV